MWRLAAGVQRRCSPRRRRRPQAALAGDTRRTVAGSESSWRQSLGRSPLSATARRECLHPQRFRRVRETSGLYTMVTQDLVRVKSRVKSFYRGQGIGCREALPEPSWRSGARCGTPGAAPRWRCEKYNECQTPKEAPHEVPLQTLQRYPAGGCPKRVGFGHSTRPPPDQGRAEACGCFWGDPFERPLPEVLPGSERANRPAGGARARA